jgi:8-oxo-dGTP pyrophosphatase MutT (NUDIX family)
MVVPVRMSRDWEVLILRRGPEKGGIWAPVTGNVEAGESTRAAAARELQEETGFGAAAALHPTRFVNRFTKRVDGRDVEFEEEVFAAVVRPGIPVKVSHEHVEAQWIPPEEAVRLVAFDGCKEGVRRALAAVEPKAS